MTSVKAVTSLPRTRRKKIGRHQIVSAKRKQLWGEVLEPRLMMAVDTPDIVVGRVLSAYSVADVQDNQLQITYTVYNQEAEDVSGVLLTSTLQAGVTFVDATQLPDQNGQELAWSLGTIPAYGRASVELTVDLANNTILTIDDGAEAFSTLNARASTDAAPAAVLKSSPLPASLLASTVDANTTDPFIQEQAARLDYDPQRIIDFLQDDIGYESYVGSLRGSRGTLWSQAANALDEASLGVALFRASGIPAQYAAGTLSDPLAQQLILSMFPESFQFAGFAPSGTDTSDPANDLNLLNEARQHYWIQIDMGGGLQDIDTTFKNSTLGQTFATVSGQFSEVADNLRHKVQVTLDAETYSQASAAFGFGDGLSTANVLNQTFSSVELVGRPLSLGFFVSNVQIPSPIFTSKTLTYSPYVVIGDEALEETQLPHALRGTDFQEVMTNFPLGSSLLTGLFLRTKLTGPDGPAETFERSLVDRIGYAVRQGSVAGSVSVDPNGPPAINPLDIVTLSAASSTQNPGSRARFAAKLEAAQSQLAASAETATPGVTESLAREAMTALTRLQCTDVLTAGDDLDVALKALTRVVAYSSRPRLVLVSNRAEFSEALQETTLAFSIDLRRDTQRVVPFPGQLASTAQTFNFARGINQSVIEDRVATSTTGPTASLTPTSNSTVSIFQAALQQGTDFVLITANDHAELEGLDISAEAKTRISNAIDSGRLIIVPEKNVQINGSSTVGWYEYNVGTGEVIAVTEDGGHQATLEYRATILVIAGGFLVGTAHYIAVLNTPLSERKDVKIAAGGFLAGGVFGGDKAIKFFAPAQYQNAVQSLFAIALVTFTLELFFTGHLKDPPADDLLFGLDAPPADPTNKASTTISAQTVTAAGTTAGQLDSKQAQISGQQTASWTSASISSFDFTSATFTGAVLTDANNAVVGTGIVTGSSRSTTQSQISGNNQFVVSGVGSLAVYGPAGSPLGVSAEWESYTADITGNLSIKVTVQSGALLLNGNAVPAGTYTISTSHAVLAGTGNTSSPNFAGSASIAAAGTKIYFGPSAGNVIVGADSIDVAQGFTLAEYAGTVTVVPDGSNVDVTLNGNSAQALRVLPTTAALTIDQNTPAAFGVSINTSWVGEFTLSVEAPSGWTAAIDSAGQVTISSAPGLQNGTHPIRIVARSVSDPSLFATADVVATVLPTTPGLNLDVVSDASFTVPFNGAQIPTSFRATMHNLGPDAETYDLTFPNPPAGFNILRSADSLTVPAGRTGISGIYLEPNGVLPAPGTSISFTVTATSRTNPLITQSETFTFPMPAVAAVTVTSEPASVGTIPGAPVTAVVTIKNVGNVPYQLGIGAQLPNGLTVSGLTTPVSLAVGQTTSQTLTLTPAANTPLNSTLSPTFVYGPAVAANQAQVLQLNTGDAFVEAGQPVTVSADVFAGVLQAQQGSIVFVVKNSLGGTIQTSAPIPLALDVVAATQTINLGMIATTGFANGEYTIEATVRDASNQALPGALGVGKFVVGLPLAAVQDVTPNTVTEGLELTYVTHEASVRSSVNLSLQPLVSLVDTNGTALNVALSGNLAYVAGTKEVTIVNLANPANPQFAGSFGAAQLAQDSFNVAQIVGGNLVIGSQSTVNANNSNIIVYSLANPLSPQLVSNTVVPYRFLTDLLVQGTTAVMPTSGITFSLPGTIINQFGDVVTLNLTNPASPAIADVLFNTNGSPNGGTTRQTGGTLVNANLAYVGSSTFTGNDTTTGNGRVLIVNIADPANITVAGELQIPGVKQVLDIAIDGNRALVVGSSGSVRNPFNGFGDLGLEGTLALTMLDITNPAAPTILGTTLTTTAEFPKGTAPGLLQAVSLGGQQFAVSGVKVPQDGFKLVIVDASQPADIQARYLTTPSLINGLSVAGPFLHASSAAGLATYRIDALTAKSIVVSVQVPNGTGVDVDESSFNVTPAQIIAGPTFDTLQWNFNIGADQLAQEITWESNLTGFTPGTTREITLGATIDYGGSTSDLTLPPQVVAATSATQTIQLPVRVVVPGADAIASAAAIAAQTGSSDLANRLSDLTTSLTALVQNPGSAVALSQSLASIDAIEVLIAADPFLKQLSGDLAAAQTALAAATTPAQVQSAIVGLGGVLSDLDGLLRDIAGHGFELGILQNVRTVQPNTAARFDVILRNTGSQTTTYDFALSGLPVNASATLNQTSVTLAPGEAIGVLGATQEVFFNVSQTGNSLVAFGFTLTATAREAPLLSRQSQAAVALRNEFIGVAGVELSTFFAQQGTAVGVTANLVSSVNSPTPVSVFYQARNEANQIVFTSPEVAATLQIATPLNDVVLAAFDTTALTDGTYKIEVVVEDQLGTPIPGATAFNTLLVGTPLSASLTVRGRGGLNAEFFDFTSALSVIPNFTGLTADVTRLDNTVNYPSIGSAWAGLDSRFIDTFAARHTGYINIPADGSYTFYVSSDDGGRMFLDGVQIINNDGIHGMSEASATRTLTAGFHQVRIEYFENNGGAGLTFSWAGPGIEKSIVPELVLFPTADQPGSSVTLPAGTHTLNNRLQIEAETVFTNPLTFRGLIDTPAIGTSVAVLGNIAYVAGTEDISIVDVSVPTSPTIVGSFASAQIVNGGLNLIEVQGNRLIVGATTRLNATVFQLFIYDITNPQSPSLLGSGSINYSFMSHMVVSGNTVYVPTNGYTYFISGGDIFDHFGDFVAVDITNPSSIALADVLFNDRGSNAGSSTNQHNVAVINSNVAYVVGSTATGGNTQVGNGRVLIVDTSNPANLTLQSQLVIPGTIHALNIAVDGNRALVMGSTGGWRDNFGSTANSGMTGNVTLTMLDITNPLNPTILGTTNVLTGATFATDGLDGRRWHTLALGNGLFTVSGILKDGAPALLIVDPTDPTNVVVSASTVPQLVNGMAVSGDRLYTSSATGLAIYDIGDLQNIPLTASVQVPKGTGVSIVPNSFNFPPSQIISGVNFDTLVWNRTLAFGNTAFDFTWQTTVTNLAGGEQRSVTAGTTIVADSLSVALPDTVAVGLPGQQLSLAITPPARTLQPGDTATFTVTVNNPNATAGTFNLSLAGLPAEWVTLPASVNIPALGSAQVPLQIKSDVFAALGDQGFTVIATSGAQQGFAEGNLEFIGPARTVNPQSHGVVATVSPTIATVGRGTTAAYTVRVVNTGSNVDTFNLAATLPPGFTATLEQSSVTIPPGASNFREVTLLITAPLTAVAGTVPFTVTATSATLPAIASSATANVNVVTAGVDVALSPAAGPAGSTFQMTVTNRGSATDTFALALGGPGALVASLAQTSVTLAPGASQVINVTVAQINFAVQPSLQLVGIATSQNNSAVRDQAAASITIPATFGLRTGFDEDTITLATPGPGTFLLLVDNLGNSEDAYTAEIVATSGPLSATLISLDGTAVQTVPIFRLPGLTTGAIVVNANLAANGSGTITVRVRSLTNDTIVSQSIATLRSTITDFGDAPDSYGTTLARDGARHFAIGPQLGAARDPEVDGMPTSNALGDDNTAVPDDEDGVVLPGLFVSGNCDCAGTGLGNVITVNATATGYLDAWVDFNRNGTFEASEKIANSVRVNAGANQLIVNVPASISAGASFARFRISSLGGLGPIGEAADGEVEDYAVQLFNPAAGSSGVIADPNNAAARVLYIKGTSWTDSIVVRQTSASTVTVYVAPFGTTKSFALNSFDRIVICAGAGADAIAIEAPITKPSVIYGEEDNDAISGGLGPDIIFGGQGVDTIAGWAGDDIISGGAGVDTISGGDGFDRLVETGSGTLFLSNTSFKNGGENNTIAYLEAATLSGSNAPDSFDVTGWSGPLSVDGGGGTNTIIDGGNANFVLSEFALVRSGATPRTVTLANIQNAVLTGGSGNNSFNLSAWPFAATLIGGQGTDSFTAQGQNDFTLTDNMLLRPTQGIIRLSGVENAVLTGSNSANTFQVNGWSNTATLNGAGGNDKLVISGNSNFTLTNSLLSRSVGGSFTLSSIEQAEIGGGAGNNTLNAAAFSGQVKLDGGAGNDTLTGGSGVALLIGGAGNDTINAGSGRSMLMGGSGLDRLTGGANDDLLISGQTVHDDNSAALALLLAEWASAASYANRVAHLTGTPGGLNGSIRLDGSNVIHDTAVDILLGNAGEDLFFAKLTTPAQDSLGDKGANESAL